MKLFLVTPLLWSVASGYLHFLSNEYIEELNSKEMSWKAGHNFPEETTLEEITGLLGVLPGESGFKIPRKVNSLPEGFVAPDSFDARKEWPNCPTIKEIRDQGSCGSCWAVAAVSVMSDRQCIHSKDKDKTRYSAEDLTSCCSICGNGNGCTGGYPDAAFSYWKTHGIVSGGRYNSKEGCKPYTIPECEHYIIGERPPCGATLPTPACKKSCIASYDLGYSKDKKYGDLIYTFHHQEAEIQNEIMINGPVEASFTIYEDFVNYKSGVYKRQSLVPLGGHAVRIIGWGTEGSDPYWLVANSWNSNWGDKGTFKILRGKDECGIESSIVTGIPRL